MTAQRFVVVRNGRRFSLVDSAHPIHGWTVVADCHDPDDADALAEQLNASSARYHLSRELAEESRMAEAGL